MTHGSRDRIKALTCIACKKNKKKDTDQKGRSASEKEVLKKFYLLSQITLQVSCQVLKKRNLHPKKAYLSLLRQLPPLLPRVRCKEIEERVESVQILLP